MNLDENENEKLQLNNCDFLKSVTQNNRKEEEEKF